jgi:hypothetical protein
VYYIITHISDVHSKMINKFILGKIGTALMFGELTILLLSGSPAPGIIDSFWSYNKTEINKPPILRNPNFNEPNQRNPNIYQPNQGGGLDEVLSSFNLNPFGGNPDNNNQNNQDDGFTSGFSYVPNGPEKDSKSNKEITASDIPNIINNEGLVTSGGLGRPVLIEIDGTNQVFDSGFAAKRFTAYPSSSIGGIEAKLDRDTKRLNSFYLFLIDDEGTLLKKSNYDHGLLYTDRISTHTGNVQFVWNNWDLPINKRINAIVAYGPDSLRRDSRIEILENITLSTYSNDINNKTQEILASNGYQLLIEDGKITILDSYETRISSLSYVLTSGNVEIERADKYSMGRSLTIDINQGKYSIGVLLETIIRGEIQKTILHGNYL